MADKTGQLLEIKEKFDREIPPDEIERLRAFVGTVSKDGYEDMTRGFDFDKPLTFYYGMLSAYNHCHNVIGWWASNFKNNEQIKKAFLAVGNLAPFVADRIQTMTPTWRDQFPTRSPCVFLGHGRSILWEQVASEVLAPRRIPYEEFNSQSTASMTAVDRVTEMLETVTFAIMLVTGDDETRDGISRARQNVIHEIGLLQGALGFRKVALLVQDGVEWLSNLDGIQQIRFKNEHTIAQSWRELEQMMEREGQFVNE
jgi:predicted nucleotide-binding protein